MAPGTFAKSIRLGGAPHWRSLATQSHPRNIVMKSQVKTITKSAIKNNSDGSESSIIGRHRKPIGPFRT